MLLLFVNEVVSFYASVVTIVIWLILADVMCVEHNISHLYLPSISMSCTCVSFQLSVGSNCKFNKNGIITFYQGIEFHNVNCNCF